MASDALVDFTARYMNAVRLGVDAIDAAAPDLPNACSRCLHRPTCHDSFGAADKTDLGIYPFDAGTLDRMVRSRQEAFNPRDLLGVVAETLTTRLGELDEGRFPSASWARQFEPRDHDRPPLPTLSLPTQQAVEQAPKPEQRNVLLTFWGGVPDQLCNLAPGIHEAFDIPLIADVGARIERPPVAVASQPPVADESDQITADVQAWRDGIRLPADRALVIRHWFQDAIWGEVDEEGSLYPPAVRHSVFSNYTDVEIENSGGSGGATRGDRFRVTLKATNENALLFAAILNAQAAGGWRFDGGPEALVAFLARVDAEVARLRTYIDQRFAAQRSGREAAVQLLALTGLLSGAGGASDTATLLAAAMSDPADPAESLPDTWRSLVTIARPHHRAIRDFVLQTGHISLSRADPLAIDGTALAPALQALAKTWAVPAPDPELLRPAQTLQAALESRLPLALEGAKAALDAWWQAVTPTIGKPATASRRAKKWLETLQQAESDGFLSSAGRWRELDPTRLQQTINAVEGCLEQWPSRSLGQQLWRERRECLGPAWNQLGPRSRRSPPPSRTRSAEPPTRSATRRPARHWTASNVASTRWHAPPASPTSNPMEASAPLRSIDELSTELSAAVARAVAANADAAVAAAFDKMSADVEAVAAAVAEARNVLYGAHDLALEADERADLEARRDALAQRIQAVRAQFATEPTAIRRGALWREAKVAYDALSVALQTHRDVAYQRLLDPFAQEDRQQLVTLPHGTPGVECLPAGDRGVRSWCATRPLALHRISTGPSPWDERLAELRAQTEQDAIPAEHRSTWRQLLGSGLPLDELNDEFRQWLRTRDLEKNIVVRLGIR